MKTALYVAAVARTYRKAIDDYLESEEKYRANMEWYRSEISKCTYRRFTTGFYFQKPDESAQIYDSNTYVNEYIYLGIAMQTADHAIDLQQGVQQGFFVRIEQKNKFCVGDEIEIMKPDERNIPVKVLSMLTEDGQRVESAPHPGQVLWVSLSSPAEKYDLLRTSKQKES